MQILRVLNIVKIYILEEKMVFEGRVQYFVLPCVAFMYKRKVVEQDTCHS